MSLLLLFQGGGAAQFSLAADPGAFAWTGTAAALNSGRRVTADPGSFAWTGTAAVLSFGVRLVASNGTFNWSGIAATLLATHNPLAAASGSYTWTGAATKVIMDVIHAEGGGPLIIND